jgi:hypothetical protein
MSQQQLQNLRRISWIFDELVSVPGTNMKVGLDALMGLIPGGGDLVGGAVSAYAILIARKVGAPAAVIIRMAINVIIDAVFGAVPLLGDVFDATWKANRKNLDLLERYVQQPQEVKRGSTLVVILALGLMIAALVGIAFLTVWIIKVIFSMM